MTAFAKRRQMVLAGLTLATSLQAVPAIAETAGVTKMTDTENLHREARNKALVRASFDAWAQGTGSPFDLLADDATWTIEGRSAASKTYANREAFMREVIRPFNARMRAGLKPTIRNIYADGDAVAIFFDAKATARDGKPYVNTYSWFFDMRDGKVIKASAMFDSIEFNDLWSRVTPVEAEKR